MVEEDLMDIVLDPDRIPNHEFSRMRMKCKLILAVLFIFAINSLYGYDTGKKPLKAMALSVVIPGGGQIYNESYYKAAGVIAIEGYFIGSLLYSHYKLDSYYDKAMNAESIELYNYYRDQYNKHFSLRQSNTWWLVSIVFISVIDAFVDANLYNYDQERGNVQLQFEDKRIGISWRF